MSFLSLGGTVYGIQASGATQSESVYIGELTRSASNKLRSGRRVPKRSWTFTLRSMIQSDFDALLAVIGVDVVLTASGDALSGASVSVIATLSSAPYEKRGTTFMRAPTLTLQEV